MRLACKALVALQIVMHGGIVVSASAATGADSGESEFRWAKGLIYSYYGENIQTNLNEAKTSIAKAEEKGYPSSKIWAIKAESALREVQFGSMDYRVKGTIRSFAYRAIQSDRRDPSGYAVLAHLELVEECFPCARVWAEYGLRASSNDPEAQFAAALAHLAIRDRGNADRFLAKAMQATPDLARRADMQLNYAMKLAEIGDLETAEKSFRQAIDIAGTSRIRPFCTYQYARFLLFQRGDADGALREMKSFNAISTSRKAQVILDMASYLKWARLSLASKAASDDSPPESTGFTSVKTAFVEGALHAGTGEITLAMLKARAIKDINLKDTNSNTALIAAARSNNLTLMRELIARKADVNAQNSRSERALTFVAANGDIDAARLLIGKGAAVNFVDGDGSSPITIAIQKGHAKFADLLFAHHATLESSTTKAGVLIVAAAANGNRVIVELLIKRGVNVNAKDDYGQTALISATIYGQRDIVRLLLDKKANAETRFLGSTALDYAKERGDADLIELLSGARKLAI
jgi:ankyrin repeat protein